MKSDRQQLIESLATGDINEILKKSECKYIFHVFVFDNPDGSARYEMKVRNQVDGTNEKRSGEGNYEDAFTPDELRYVNFCKRIDRICCLVIQ